MLNTEGSVIKKFLVTTLAWIIWGYTWTPLDKATEAATAILYGKP